MKPEHVITWAVAGLARNNEALEALDIRYAAAKYAYETSFINRLFGFKYEKSYSGDRGWLGIWSFSLFNSRSARFIAILKEARYKNKCSYSTMEIEGENWRISFYNYCEKYHIPY